jgi:hypothetical protein
VLYGLCVKEEAMFVDEVFVDEVFVDELRGEEKGGCARDPL